MVLMRLAQATCTMEGVETGTKGFSATRYSSDVFRQNSIYGTEFGLTYWRFVALHAIESSRYGTPLAMGTPLISFLWTSYLTGARLGKGGIIVRARQARAMSAFGLWKA